MGCHSSGGPSAITAFSERSEVFDSGRSACSRERMKTVGVVVDGAGHGPMRTQEQFRTASADEKGRRRGFACQGSGIPDCLTRAGRLWVPSCQFGSPGAARTVDPITALDEPTRTATLVL